MIQYIIYLFFYQSYSFNVIFSFDLYSLKQNQMQGNKSTFLTADSNNLVFQAYKQLNKMIDDMDRKVEHVIKKHESQFLYAYRNHIAKIKKELTEIKHKSEEQQKMFSSNDRIQYLQKQMVIFREEALKLYNKLDEKTQENDFLKNRLKQYEKEHQMLDYNEREKRRTMKVQQMNKTILQAKVHELQAHLTQKHQEISKLNRKVQVLKEETQRRSIMDYKVASLSGSRRVESLRESQKVRKPEVYDSQMKEWFLDCIRTVKKEIAMRNSSNIILQISHITSIDEFRTVDKLRLLELFLQNEKLITWMYQRIFPDRLSQLRYKLSSQSDKQSNSDKDNEQLKASQFQQKFLPKVGRLAKSQLRSSYVVRNGKLNISAFDKS